METDAIADQFRRRTEAILREAEALLENDHFVSANGHHSSGWIDKDAINPHASAVSELCQMLAQTITPFQGDILCGPAQGGLIVALWTSFHATLPGVFVERGPAEKGELTGRFTFRRGYDHWVKGKRVVIVDDVVNTGHSVLQTITAVENAGGIVAGIACYVDRGNVTAADMGGHPYRFLLQWKIPSWPEDQTPAESAARPVNTRLAHGVEYLAQKAARL
jgi:orotate phosphoribosyltransferase